MPLPLLLLSNTRCGGVVGAGKKTPVLPCLASSIGMRVNLLHGTFWLRRGFILCFRFIFVDHLMKSSQEPRGESLFSRSFWAMAVVLLLAAGAVRLVSNRLPSLWRHADPEVIEPEPEPGALDLPSGISPAGFHSRQPVDASGYSFVLPQVKPWPAEASLDEVAQSWKKPGHEIAEEMVEKISDSLADDDLIALQTQEATCWTYDGEPKRAFELITKLRSRVENDPELSAKKLYTLIYLQGITSLRQGETENCVMCRGENSCILPLKPAARHTNQTGSRRAIQYFMEYLKEFPDDLEVKWLLNIAHMTLDEYPQGVDKRFLVSLEHYNANEYSIGKFRDVGHLAGISRLNMAGGTILDDFDNDGLLDAIFTTLDPTQPMAYFKNKGDGTFEDRTAEGGVSDQLGGLNCVQADYDNDGLLDVYIPRGAWLPDSMRMRPSLLKNQGDGKFADVTQESGLLKPLNTDTAQFADFDNDGWLDLFVCGEVQPSCLFRNLGDGKFQDVAAEAGLGEIPSMWKGCSWFDYDNDDYPDLFLNSYTGTPKLFHNERNGTFTDATAALGIDGPEKGLSCWTWDYDNDGWLDIFATCYDRTLADVIRGLVGEPHGRKQNKLYRNLEGKKFQDVTQEAGLDQCFSTMGSNFCDFDNDGFLDFYLGTGDHEVSTLVPNRMFRNLAGRRFVDITSSSGTGHLQKGHGVGCGDWDRDGDADIMIEMGGAIPGDKYHNVLFLNPGQGNHWLNVKLVGKKTNRSAIGTRIKVVGGGEKSLNVYRSVCSGSSFGANPLEQLIGLGATDRIDRLEVYWPTSRTTQVFRDIPADQAIEITEFAEEYRTLPYQAVKPPTEEVTAN